MVHWIQSEPQGGGADVLKLERTHVSLTNKFLMPIFFQKKEMELYLSPTPTYLEQAFRAKWLFRVHGYLKGKQCIFFKNYGWIFTFGLSKQGTKLLLGDVLLPLGLERMGRWESSWQNENIFGFVSHFGRNGHGCGKLLKPEGAKNVEGAKGKAYTHLYLQEDSKTRGAVAPGPLIWTALGTDEYPWHLASHYHIGLR